MISSASTAAANAASKAAGRRADRPSDGRHGSDNNDLTVIKNRMTDAARKTALPPDTTLRVWLRDMTPAGTWQDMDYHDTANGKWSPSQHLGRVQGLALAYLIPTLSGNQPNPNFHRAPLLEAALRGFDGWFSALPPGTPPAPAHPGNAFKDNLTTPTSKNWWHNEIGQPLTMAALLMLLENELSDERRSKGLQILARSWVPQDTSGINTGANLSWRARITTARATLTGDAHLLHQVVAALENTAQITDGEGIQADYSFWQHGPQFYLLGYGQGYSADLTELSELFRATTFALRPEIVQTLTNLTLDGYQWAMRGPDADGNAMGRGIANPRKDDTTDLLNITARLLTIDGGPRKTELQAFRGRLLKQAGAAPLMGNRAFWRSGYMSHQREHFGVSVRVTSQYLRGGEIINGQGVQSRYTGDGVTYLMRTGSEYRNLSPVMNFRRLPGTTGALSPQKPVMPSPYVWGVGHFAGGVSDGRYGATGYDYIRDGVSARKGWFFFDDEYVCLGAGITSNADVADPIVTSAEQCRLLGAITRSEAGAQGVPWVAHGDTAFFFPGQMQTVVVESGPQTGTWLAVNSDSTDKTVVTENVFSLYLNHGVRPQNANYAYVVVPQIAPEKRLAAAAQLPVAVLSNTPACQAVRHAALGLIEAVFYAPGELKVTRSLSVSVSHACLLLLRQFPDGAITLTLANPDNPPLRGYDNSRVQQFLPTPDPPRPPVVMAVELSASLAGRDTTRLPGGRTRVSFSLPTGMQAGQSVSKTLQSTGK